MRISVNAPLCEGEGVEINVNLSVDDFLRFMPGVEMSRGWAGYATIEMPICTKYELMRKLSIMLQRMSEVAEEIE